MNSPQLSTLVLIWPRHESWENSHSNSRFSTTLMHTLASQLSCNSCSRLTGAWELRKLSCKFSLLNSHQLSCKFSLLNSHATLVLVWPAHESWENSHANSRFSILINLPRAQVLLKNFKIEYNLSLVKSFYISRKLGGGEIVNLASFQMWSTLIVT